MNVKEINISNRIYNYYLDCLFKAKISETKKIIITEKSYNDLVIYFTRCDRRTSIAWLSLYCYYELMRKTEEYERQNCLICADNILYKVLNIIKETLSNQKFDDTKILIDTDNKLSDDFTVKNIMNLITVLLKIAISLMNNYF